MFTFYLFRSNLHDWNISRFVNFDPELVVKILPKKTSKLKTYQMANITVLDILWHFTHLKVCIYVVQWDFGDREGLRTFEIVILTVIKKSNVSS